LSHVASHAMAHLQWYYDMQVFLYCKQALLYCKLIASNMELNLNNMWTQELQLERTIFSSMTTCTMIMHLEQVILSSTITSTIKNFTYVHAPCDKIILQLWWISKVVIATSLKLTIKVCDLVFTKLKIQILWSIISLTINFKSICRKFCGDTQVTQCITNYKKRSESAKRQRWQTLKKQEDHS
jgi:hypothetical protein